MRYGRGNEIYIKSLPTECRRLVPFANSLDPDKAGNVEYDLDSICLTRIWHSWKISFRNILLGEKHQQMTRQHL